MNEFEVSAEVRTALGKGANRRLRRTGKVPAILYGAGQVNAPLQVNSTAIQKLMENEAFFSHILKVKVDGSETQAVVKALDRHPVTDKVTHMDFLRVSSTHEISMHVPLHFINEETAPGAKEGGVFGHLMLDVDISCLPQNLPEYIEIDLGGMELGDTFHLSEITLPEGVALSAFKTGEIEEHDLPVVSLHQPQKLEIDDAEEEDDEVAAPDVEPEEKDD